MSEQQKPPVPGTHAVTTPNRRPLTPIESLSIDMKKDLLTKVQNYYGQNEGEALSFMTAAVEYVRRVPKLLLVERMSLLTALLTAAQFRFMPSGVNGECYIIPYGKEAKFQLGYQGIITLLYRTGKISGITSNIIFKNDKFEYEEGLEPILIHKPAMFGVERGEPIGVYTVAIMKDGSRTFKVMDMAAIMQIKELSKAKDSKDSPWNSDQDPEMWMWKKTCLIQHAKLLPKTREIQQAIEEDYKGEGSDRGNLDAGGPAVGRAFHDPAQFVTPPVGHIPDAEFEAANDALKERQAAAEDEAKRAEPAIQVGEIIASKPVTEDDIAAYEKNEKENPEK